MSEVRVHPSTIEPCGTCGGSGEVPSPEPIECYDCHGFGLYVWVDRGDSEAWADLVAASGSKERGDG